MAKLGEDWIFIGLGLGAAYLVYKATKGITGITDSVSNTAQGYIDAASIDNLSKTWDNKFTETGIFSGGLIAQTMRLTEKVSSLFDKKITNNTPNSPDITATANSLNKTSSIINSKLPMTEQVPIVMSPVVRSITTGSFIENKPAQPFFTPQKNSVLEKSVVYVAPKTSTPTKATLPIFNKKTGKWSI